MATIIRLSCDRCDGESLLPTFGSVEHARQVHARDGWQHTAVISSRTPSTPFEAVDLCPVCAGTNPDYYQAEPF